MAIYVTGDVHGRAEYGSSRFAFKNWPLGRTLTRDDAVIVAGDFGFVWDGSNAEKYWLDWFESKPWTTCFVDGNHENHRMLAELPVREWSGGLVHEARPHVLHLMRGEVFDIGGLTVLAMGGAASNDRQCRREGRSWWPEEMPSEEEMERCRASLDLVGWKVDYVVTHEAPAALAEGLCRVLRARISGRPASAIPCRARRAARLPRLVLRPLPRRRMARRQAPPCLPRHRADRRCCARL